MMASRMLQKTGGVLVRRGAAVSRQVTARPAAGNMARRMASTENGGYNEPTGYLFGERPPPSGKKRVKADWENIWYVGIFGGMAFGFLLQYYKPDTSLDSWASEEARKRLDEREGDGWKYNPSQYSGWYKGGESASKSNSEKLV